MNVWITFAISVFTGLIAIINPIANIPAFLALAGDYSTKRKKRIAKKACITAVTIIIGFIVLGKFIFSIFGITIPAFKITGGILIAKIGFNMLQAKNVKKKKENAEEMAEECEEDDMSIAISPLAIPLLAGPGAIVTTMNFISNTTYIHLLIVSIITLIVFYINYLALRSGDYIVSKLGNNFINVLDKLMGLILSIMGTGMVLNGIELWIKAMH